jgi:purine-binding chemotaxis protein CheW
MEATLGNINQQYCGFIVEGEHFAIPVLRIQEVIKPLQITPIPLAPNFVQGLINLRGQIVTVMDLSELFEIDQHENSNNEKMNIIIQGEDGHYALQVSEITDIINIDGKSVESRPANLKGSLSNYIEKVFKTENGLVSLLDVDLIINFKIAA